MELILKLKSAQLEIELGLSLATITIIIKGVAKKTLCFKFYYFGLCLLKEYDIYKFLLLRV